MKQERYLRRHRKGFIDNTTLAILAVATIIVFSVFVYKAYINFRDKMTIQSCKNSVEAHTVIATRTAREMFTDIKCPTKDIIIKDNRKAKDIIAEDMHRCWYIWGQGTGQYFQGSGTFCQVCGIYQFGDKEQQVNGFMNYLGTQPIKVKYAGDIQGTTYADYFAGVSTPKSAQMVKMNVATLSDVDYINTSQRYATIFVYASGKKFIQQAMEGGGRSTLGTVGMFGLLGGTAAVGVGIFIASNPVGWVVGGVLAVGVGVGAIWEALHVVEPESVQFIVFRPYNNQTLDDIGCEKMYVNQMSNAGTG
jgi:hypothetical protein